MKFFKKILFPPLFLIMILSILCGYGLIYVFVHSLHETLNAYLLYALSAYTLVVLILYLVFNINKLKLKFKNNGIVTWINNNPFFKKYKEDMVYRKHVSLYSSIIFSFGFSLLKYIIAYIYSSIWALSIAIYYTMISIIKMNLIRSLHKSDKLVDLYKKRKHEIINYIRTGFLLFVLNATMSGMVIQMIWQNKSNIYPEFVIYVIALYTFYSLITSIIHIIKNRKYDRPIIWALDYVGLVGAVMSMFVLQTSLITEFGADFVFQRVMNIITGTFVMIFVLFIACMIVISGIRHLKTLKNRGI